MWPTARIVSLHLTARTTTPGSELPVAGSVQGERACPWRGGLRCQRRPTSPTGSLWGRAWPRAGHRVGLHIHARATAPHFCDVFTQIPGNVGWKSLLTKRLEGVWNRIPLVWAISWVPQILLFLVRSHFQPCPYAVREGTRSLSCLLCIPWTHTEPAVHECMGLECRGGRPLHPRPVCWVQGPFSGGQPQDAVFLTLLPCVGKLYCEEQWLSHLGHVSLLFGELGFCPLCPQLRKEVGFSLYPPPKVSSWGRAYNAGGSAGLW